MPQFTWLPFFEEMLATICQRYDKHSLCDVFHKIFADAGGTKDWFEDGSNDPLREIDPLTFIAYFNRGNTEDKRIDWCSQAGNILKLASPVPGDFAGVPTISSQNTWFFGYTDATHSASSRHTRSRGTSDIDDLWEFARQLDNDPAKLSEELFAKVIRIHNSGLAKLTQLMFICKPKTFLAMNNKDCDYLDEYGIEAKQAKKFIEATGSLSRYLELLDKVQGEFSDTETPFYQISHNAHLRISMDTIENPACKDLVKALVNQLKQHDELRISWKQYEEEDAVFYLWFKHKNKSVPGSARLGLSISEAIALLCNEYEYDVTDPKADNGLPSDTFSRLQKLISSMCETYDVFLAVSNSLSPNLKKYITDEELIEAFTDIETAQRIFAKIGNDPLPKEYYGKQQEGEVALPIAEPKVPDDHESSPRTYTIDDAMGDLFIEKEEFGNIVRLLRHKKNIILQGAPGVGKTFIARRLAYTLMGFKDDARVQMIQFHQSYSYEDFIQGYRPSGREFPLKDGVFYEFCQKAKCGPENKYVFVIDEINRGNLSKIFGELMMLIESDKRGPEFAVPLTYSVSGDKKFYIPDNLYLVGTMNKTDRSLAMVDYALRRRFSFITLEPCFESTKFREHLNVRGVPVVLIDRIVNMMTQLNRDIIGDDKNLGRDYVIGHSFFCPDGNYREYDERWYRLIVTHEIRPLLEEYWFDNQEKVEASMKDLLA